MITREEMEARIGEGIRRAERLNTELEEFARQRALRKKEAATNGSKADPRYWTQSRTRDAEWAGWIWWRFVEQAGRSGELHDRAIHYLIGARGDVQKPVKKGQLDADIYQLTNSDWEFLTPAVKDAVLLGMIPAGGIADARTPAASYAYTSGDVEDEDAISASWLEQIIREGTAQFFYQAWDPTLSRPMGAGRRDYVIVWTEKTTIDRFLLPLVQRYRCSYCPGQGEATLTSIIEMARRAHAAGMNLRVIVVSDWDPGGRSMGIALASKLDHMVREGLVASGLSKITVERVLLTPEQAQQFALPAMPVKPTDSRAPQWVRQTGSADTWELDALVALAPPGSLEALVEHALRRYVDPADLRRFDAANNAVRQAVDAAVRRLAASEYHEELQGFAEGIRDAALEAMVEEGPELAMADVEEPPDPLFDSERNMLQQRIRYAQERQETEILRRLG